MDDSKHIEEKLERLNLILRTIRNVDQIILTEKGRDQLIQNVCNSLVKTRGYYNAWIALLDESGRFKTFAEAGLGDKFLSLTKQLELNGATECGQRALLQQKAVVISDPATACSDCPLAKGYRRRGGITTRLHHRGKLYGLLCASVPVGLITEAKERSLFEDVAGDIGFALHKIDLEEEHEKAEESLKESENRYRALFDNANDGMLVSDLKGNIIMANSVMSDLTGYTNDELTNMNMSQFLSTSSFETLVRSVKQQPDNKSESSVQRYELQMITKDRTERTIEVGTSLLTSAERPPIIQTIARDITEQRRARENLRIYARRAILAQEEERKRVARELHDETAQAIASLGIELGGLTRAKRLDARQISTRLEELRHRADDILRGIRFLSLGLRPPMLEEFGLLVSLRELVDNLVDMQGMTIQFEVKGTPRRLSPDVEIALYRIVQEALNNIGKHANATDGQLEIAFHRKKVNLTISDNGKGFTLPPATDDFAYSDSLGLSGMRERAKLINGNLTIHSQEGEGTTLELEVLH